MLSIRSLIAAGVLVIASTLFYPDTSIGCPQGSTSTPSGIAQPHLDKSYVDVSNFPNVHLSMRYATDNNFMKKNVYGDFHRCFLHDIAANKFREAVRQLQQEKPGWKFVVFDCLRPRSIQEEVFEVVKGSAQQPYVANPKIGSIHNYGFAIDLSLEDDNGHELDMGTGFEDFSPLSRPDQERQKS